MKEYVFSGEYSGELYRSKDLKDMYETSKDIKELDRSHHIHDNYYYELEIENGKMLEIYDVKIYKRKNKIYCKGI